MARTQFFQVLYILFICISNSYAVTGLDLSNSNPLGLLDNCSSINSTAKVEIHSAFRKNCADEISRSCSPPIFVEKHANCAARDSNDLKLLKASVVQLKALIDNYQFEPDFDFFPYSDSLIINIVTLDSSFRYSINELLLLDRSTDVRSISNLSVKLFSEKNTFQKMLAHYENSLSTVVVREAVAAPVYVFKTMKKAILTTEQLAQIQVKRILKNSNYKLLLTSFSEYEEATSLLHYLQEQTSNMEMKILIDKKGDYRKYEILIQGFANRNEAAAYLKELTELGIQ